jgi:hypothetical protein
VYKLRSWLFWDITQRRLVVVYRRFGTTYRSHLLGPNIPRLPNLIRTAAEAWISAYVQISHFPSMWYTSPCAVLIPEITLTRTGEVEGMWSNSSCRYLCLPRCIAIFTTPIKLKTTKYMSFLRMRAQYVHPYKVTELCFTSSYTLSSVL